MMVGAGPGTSHTDVFAAYGFAPVVLGVVLVDLLQNRQIGDLVPAARHNVRDDHDHERNVHEARNPLMDLVLGLHFDHVGLVRWAAAGGSGRLG